MAGRITEFSASVALTPDLARKRLLDALVRCEGNAAAAAGELGIPLRSLWRYVDGLGIREELASIRVRHAPIVDMVRTEAYRIAGRALRVVPLDDEGQRIRVSYAAAKYNGATWAGSAEVALRILRTVLDGAKGTAAMKALHQATEG